MAALSLNRYAVRRDGNEAEVVSALEAGGVTVIKLDQPVDLLCGYRGRWHLLEVKRPNGKVRASQWGFVQDCGYRGLPVHIVRSPVEALEAVGAVR